MKFDLDAYLKAANQNLKDYKEKIPDNQVARLVDSEMKSIAPADFQLPFSVINLNGNVNPPRLIPTAGVGVRLAKVGTSSGIACEISFNGTDNWLALLPGSEIRVPFTSFVVRSVFADASILVSASQIRLIVYHREDAYFHEPDSLQSRPQEYAPDGTLIDTAWKYWNDGQLYNSVLNAPTVQFDPADPTTGFVLDGVKYIRIMLQTNGIASGGELRLWYYDPEIGGTTWFENQQTILTIGSPTSANIVWNDIPVVMQRGAMFIEARSITSAGGSGSPDITVQRWCGA